jgi:hypothetical protein
LQASERLWLLQTDANAVGPVSVAMGRRLQHVEETATRLQEQLECILTTLNEVLLAVSDK